jgi:hypothetical protein
MCFLKFSCYYFFTTYVLVLDRITSNKNVLSFSCCFFAKKKII